MIDAQDSECRVQIISTGSDYHFTAAFMQAAEKNFSFAYLVSFLFLSATFRHFD